MPLYNPPNDPSVRRFVGDVPPPPVKQIRPETALGSPLEAERLGMHSETTLFAPRVQGELNAVNQGDYVTVQETVTNLFESYTVESVQFAAGDNLLINVAGGSLNQVAGIETLTVSNSVRETAAPVAQNQTTALNEEVAPLDAPQVIEVAQAPSDDEQAIDELIAERGGSDTIVIVN